MATSYLFVGFDINTFQLTETGKVLSDQQTELLTFLLPPDLVPNGSLMLHPNPQLVHLCEVLQDEVDGILHPSALAGDVEATGH